MIDEFVGLAGTIVAVLSAACAVTHAVGAIRHPTVRAAREDIVAALLWGAIGGFAWRLVG